MRIFITGGTGYVGAAVARDLAAAGHQVAGLVRSPESAQRMRALGVTPRYGDLRDPESLVAAARDYDAIVHLAAESGAERARTERPALEALLGAAHEGRARALVITSTLFVLGDTGEQAADEETPVREIGYVAGRSALERMVLDAASDALATAVIRPGMVYGGGNGGAVSEFFRTAAEDRAATFVGEGENRWSLVHLEDVASLYRMVLEKGGRGIFHAVDGHPLRVREIAGYASRAAGQEGRVSSLPLEAARTFLGGFADALCLDQVATAPRSHALGWYPARPPFPVSAPAAFAEWRAVEGSAERSGAAAFTLRPTEVAEERRRFHRVDVQLPVLPLLGDFLSGQTGFTTVTLDLSEGGARIRVPEELPLAQEVGLILHFPDGTRHTFRGRVVRSSPYPDASGQGGAWAALEFVSLTDETRLAIASLVAGGQT